MENDKARTDNITSSSLCLHSFHEALHLNRSANVKSFADLFESVVSLDRELDGVVSNFEDFCARGHCGTDRSCREMFDIDYDSNGHPSGREELLNRLRCGVFHVINHDRCAVDFRHVLVEVSDS